MNHEIINAWKVGLNKASYTLGKEFAIGKEDELMMALVFDYPDELAKSVFKEALPMEHGFLIPFLNKPSLHVHLEGNGNITFS